ncbi:hypothetical protein B0H11DRAFT_2058875, partial [Mycena galericulata]
MPAAPNGTIPRPTNTLPAISTNLSLQTHRLTTSSQPQSGFPASGAASSRTSEDGGGDLDPEDEPFHPFFSNAARHQMITVNFTHDLSTVKELNHPSGFFKEVEAIVRIQQEAWPRIAEAKARAIKAAAEMNSAYDKPTLDLLVARPRGGISRFVSKLKEKGRKNRSPPHPLGSSCTSFV